MLVKKVKYQSITWEQPWYQQSNSLTRRLNESHDIHSEKILEGTMTKEENKIIKKNWRNFRKNFDVPNKLICFARWKNNKKSKNPKFTPEEGARRFVTAYLAQGLQRTVHQVFKHIITNFGGIKKGAYTPTEEKIMEICFYHNPRHAVKYLSTILNREPRGIYKRLKQLHEGKPAKARMKWTLEQSTKFLNLLIKHSGYSLEELKNTKIDKSVWLKLEEDMGHYYIYLQKFWYHSLHVQLFVKCDIKRNRLRKAILKKLRSSSYQVWSDIRWKEITKQFPDGFSHQFLYMTCFHFLFTERNFIKRPLQEVIAYGLEKLKLNRYRSRRLKTLILNNDNTLERVQYAKNKKNTSE